MLVLTRKPGQAVRVGEIRILVTRVSGNQVRLGFTTPPGMRAYRGELYETIQNANRAASVSPMTLADWTNKNRDEDGN